MVDTHVSLARVLTGNRLSISIRRSEGNGSEFVVWSSEVFFCFETVSGFDDCVAGFDSVSAVCKL